MNLKIELVKARAELKDTKTSKDELEVKVKGLEKELEVEKQKVDATLQENKDLKENKEVLEKNIKGYKDSLDGKEKLVNELESKIKGLEQVVDSPNGAGNPEPNEVEDPSKQAKAKTTK